MYSFRKSRILALGLALVGWLVGAALVAAPFAYICNASGASVSVIDVATGATVTTIPVASGPLAAVVTPDGGAVYVSSGSGGTISVIDTATNTVAATIPISGFPRTPGLSPDGSTLYVPSISSGTVSVVSTTTNTVVDTVTVGGSPTNVAVHPDGTKYYVPISLAFRVSVRSTATNEEIASIPVGLDPQGLAFSPDGATLYVSIAREGTIYVADTATDTVTSTIPLPGGGGVDDLVVHPDGSRLYGADDFIDHPVWVIDTATEAVIASPRLGNGVSPNGIAITSDGETVYVAGGISNAVHVLDTATNTLGAAIPVGANAHGYGPFITRIPPELTFSGDCPGAATIEVSGATPNGQVAFLGSPLGGSFTFDGPTCAGLTFGLDDPFILTVLTADASGIVQIDLDLPFDFCGWAIQAADGGRCQATNVQVIPNVPSTGS